jgi:hypothetical protein
VTATSRRHGVSTSKPGLSEPGADLSDLPMSAPHAYAESRDMNNTWYFTQELASAHQRDLRALRGHSPRRTGRRHLLLPHISAAFHRSPKSAEVRHAWQ